MKFTFQMVDVFGSDAFSGNPLAVVVATDEIDTAGMQKLARWFNLSETGSRQGIYPSFLERSFRSVKQV